MSHSAQLVLEISRTCRVMGEMKAARAAILCLVALLNTVMWGLILYFGSRALEMPIGLVWLSVAMLGIFALLLLVLGMAALSSDANSNDRPD
jgi:hypothetical protein